VIVAGSTEIVQKRAFDRRSYRYADFLEGGDFRFDTTAGRALLAEHGHWLWVGAIAVALFTVGPVYAVGAVILGGVGAGTARLLLRDRAQLAAGDIVARALTIAAAVPLFWAAAKALGLDLGCGVDLMFLGPAVGLATWATLRSAPAA